MKRKWYEETVFRHYARNEPEDKKRFVNDTVRRDFHRRFLARTIQWGQNDFFDKQEFN